MPLEELNAQLAATLDECRQALQRVPSESLLDSIRIQGFDMTRLDALFDTVAHFRGHTQEIIHMTRRMLGDRYRFAFVPATAEQGAPRDEKRSAVDYDPKVEDSSGDNR